MNKKAQAIPLLGFAGAAAAIAGIINGKYFLMFLGAILLLIGFLPGLNISSIPWYFWGVGFLVAIIAIIGNKR